MTQLVDFKLPPEATHTHSTFPESWTQSFEKSGLFTNYRASNLNGRRCDSHIYMETGAREIAMYTRVYVSSAIYAICMLQPKKVVVELQWRSLYTQY